MVWENPVSQGQEPARTTGDDGEMKEPALLSLSSHPVLLCVSSSYYHAALRDPVALLVTWEKYDGDCGGPSPIRVSKVGSV